MKKILFVVSLSVNVLFIGVFIAASLAKSHTSFLSYPTPEDGHLAASALAVFPASHGLVFNPIEINLQPGDKFYLQYSVAAGKRQGNMLINALYDPQIISVEQTGTGILITALREGETLMQMITNEGITDVALVSVTPLPN